MATIEEVLEKSGYYLGRIKGNSMQPLLNAKKSWILVGKIEKERRLFPYEILLYRRKHDGAYILHRLLKVKDEELILRGDNCLAKEMVKPEQVLGVLLEFSYQDRWYKMSGKLAKIYGRIIVACHLLVVIKQKIRG